MTIRRFCGSNFLPVASLGSAVERGVTLMAAELLALDRVQQLARLALGQLLGRFAFAGPVATAGPRNHRRFRISFVSRCVHVAPTVIGGPPPPRRSTSIAVLSSPAQCELEVPLGGGIVRLEPERLLVGANSIFQQPSLVVGRVFGGTYRRVAKVVVALLPEPGNGGSLSEAPRSLFVAVHPIQRVADRVLERRIASSIERPFEGLIGFPIAARVVE